jgi:signal transduction histidine kinase
MAAHLGYKTRDVHRWAASLHDKKGNTMITRVAGQAPAEISQHTTASGGATRRVPRVKTLIAFSLLIMVLFCIFVGYQASKAYQEAIEHGKRDAARLTKIVSDQVELTFLAVDLTLRRAVERQYFNQLFGGNLPRDIENNLRMWVEESPQIAALMLVDANGNVQIAANKPGYDQWYDYRQSLSSEESFIQLRDSPERSYFIGQHSTRLKRQPQLIVMSRRVTGIDGGFGGIILAAIDPSYFSEFFASVDFGSNRFMGLMLEDGSMLYNGPARAREAMEDADAVLDYVADHASTHQKKLHIVTDTQKFGSVLKIYSYTKLQNMPIITSVVVHEDDFLHEWRDGRLKDISFLAIFTIFGSVLSFFALTMAKQIVRVEESESSAITASQAKSEFLANMSHELRTPLNAIIGFSEMLNAGYFGALNDKQTERVQDINLCGTHLLQLISDILEFSKGEAGKLELHEDDVDIARAVQECMRMVGEKAKTKGVALTDSIVEGIPHLYADRRKIRQIIINLLSNAIKFTPEGGSVDISVARDAGGNIVLRVRDTGIGIPEEDIPKALAVFGQVHRNQSHEGTGLGLPLCKMFAELHGGKLTLSSQVGHGTTVHITLPKERVREA